MPGENPCLMAPSLALVLPFFTVLVCSEVWEVGYGDIERAYIAHSPYWNRGFSLKLYMSQTHPQERQKWLMAIAVLITHCWCRWAQLGQEASLQPCLIRLQIFRCPDHWGLRNEIQRLFIHILCVLGLFWPKSYYGKGRKILNHESSPSHTHTHP